MATSLECSGCEETIYLPELIEGRCPICREQIVERVGRVESVEE
ncbi:MAG: hypothetical protein MAG715_00822 [Methanonatronarchaeales archaeon]|nr:hypothetical protein [Methanonatronarchaeales archaeon]